MTLFVKDAARAIQPETYQVHTFDTWLDLVPPQGETGIRTIRRSIRTPEVIVLSSYDRVPHRQVPFTRRNLYRRDGFRCQYCGFHGALNELSIDHITPRSRGGSSSWENCVLACLPCNVRKGDALLSDVGLRLMAEPRRPEWSPCLNIRAMKRKASWQKFVGDRYWTIDLELTSEGSRH